LPSHRAHPPAGVDELAVIDLGTPAAGTTFDQLDLPAGPLAARLARRYLVACLPDVAPDVMDEALLLTSELVTNAVRHGAAPIRLQLHRHGGTLRVDVSDGGRSFELSPVPTWSPTSEGGRGLRLLDALAGDWGSRGQEHPAPGKTVWFELCCSPVAASL
jgi:anti-sigma regulatory factor (Ser/Thr protein kinase)